MEPWGRYLSGGVELVTSILLLLPGKTLFGAVLGLATISGAIYFHLTGLGIEVLGDGGLLFYLAVIVFVCCLLLILAYKNQAISPTKPRQ